MSGSKTTYSAALSLIGQRKAITRSAVLIAVTQALLHETGRAINKFAEQLADGYFAAVPEGLRRAPLKVPDQHAGADEYYKVLASNTKAVQRYLDGTVPVPMDLEEVWCCVLPDHYRDRAVFELCARFGVLPVMVTGDADIHALAELMRDEAAVIEAMAPILADGDIDDSDLPAAEAAVPKLKKAMASIAGLIVRLESVTGEKSLKVVGDAA
jgi:hypothetical protein